MLNVFWILELFVMLMCHFLVYIYIVRSMKKMLYTEGQLHIPAEVAVVCTRARTVQR